VAFRTDRLLLQASPQAAQAARGGLSGLRNRLMMSGVGARCRNSREGPETFVAASFIGCQASALTGSVVHVTFHRS
jgi:hypothetical protein